MDDDRVREFETALWIGGEEVYRRSIDPDCLMVVPAAPFLLSGSEAIEAVAKTPRWETVEFDDLRIGRPQEGLIVLAYRVRASRGGEAYSACCTSTYRRVEHEHWQVVQHQQSLVPTAVAKVAGGGSDALERVQKDAAEERESERGYQ
ncbi:MAG TPA: DUF4440 domain-containing protein [Allosphingosinicella sp.]|jgi:hypothetical protein